MTQEYKGLYGADECILQISMASEAVRDRRRPQQEFEQRKPEYESLEREISTIARKLLAVSLLGKGERAELERQMTALLKQRPTKTQAEQKAAPQMVAALTQENVTGALADGKLSYSQTTPPKLTEFAVKPPRGEMTVRAA